MGEHSTELYVILEGEPWLSRAKAFLEQNTYAMKAWRAYAVAQGATEMYGDLQLSGLTFAHCAKRPKGWKKPTRKGRCFPELKTEDGKRVQRELNALPKKMSPEKVLESSYIETLRWGDSSKSGDWGFSDVGFPWTTWVGWIGGTFVARIPNAKAAAQNMLDAHALREDTPHPPFKGDPLNWTPPAGMQVITRTRFDFMVAEYNLKVEEEAQLEELLTQEELASAKRLAHLTGVTP